MPKRVRGVPLLLALGLIAAILGLSGCDSALRERIELYVRIADAGVIFVDGVNGDDANLGGRDQPKRSIQAAIDLAAELLDSGEVWVAEGTYSIAETLVVREGISLLGGFQASDWSRDIDGNPTVLQGVGVETVIKPEQGVGSGTVIEGFTIRAASLSTVTCIWCQSASPTIRRNTIDAGPGDTDTIGILNSSSSPVILANTIDAGDGTAFAWGVANNSSSPKICSNVIKGSAADGYNGIRNVGSDPVIQNNTIRCGLHSDDIGIRNSSGSNCIIENNILFTSSSSCGIYEASAADTPVRVNNNDFYGCSPLYYHDSGNCTNITQLHAHLSGIASGNLAVNPDFDPNWHPEAVSVKTGGLDLSASFTRDRDWTVRTAPWSIGAYEED